MGAVYPTRMHGDNTLPKPRLWIVRGNIAHDGYSCYNIMMMSYLTNIEYSPNKTIAVICVMAALASIDIARRIKHRPTHLLFAVILATALSFGLVEVGEMILKADAFAQNAFAMALGFVLVLMCWRALFGGGDASTKAVMLGTFLFWLALHVLFKDTDEQTMVRCIAAITALIPAGIWCLLFLKYHRERFVNVLVLFMAGMLATVPILYYDALVRHGAMMQFFFFELHPVSFHSAAQTFVDVQFPDGVPFGGVLVATLVSFLLVGVIEEVSKYWVLSHAGKRMFTSIDDVMQLSIVVAIGFAFAENVINPVYFTAFVSDYLLHGAAPDPLAFVSNVLGRSVLTSMVHILATGVLGYFLGLAIFAGPYLEEQRSQGHMHRLLAALHRLLRVREVSIFRVHMLAMGLLVAIVLHGAFNFIVTLPDLLPNNPQTLSDLFGEKAPSFLRHIPLLLVPALLYVVGGFWLLTSLFLRKDNMQEHGHLVTREDYVDAIPQEA